MYHFFHFSQNLPKRSVPSLSSTTFQLLLHYTLRQDSFSLTTSLHETSYTKLLLPVIYEHVSLYLVHFQRNFTQGLHVLYLLLGLRMTGATPLLPHMPSRCARGNI
jgi:hypothetical protein